MRDQQRDRAQYGLAFAKAFGVNDVVGAETGPTQEFDR